MIDPGHPRLSIVRQCELASISRSSFYREPTAENEETLRLMRLIDEQFWPTSKSLLLRSRIAASSSWPHGSPLRAAALSSPRCSSAQSGSIRPRLRPRSRRCSAALSCGVQTAAPQRKRRRNWQRLRQTGQH